MASTSALAAQVSVETFDLGANDRVYLGAEKLVGPVEGLTFDMFIGVQDQQTEQLWVSSDYHNSNVAMKNHIAS